MLKKIIEDIRTAFSGKEKPYNMHHPDLAGQVEFAFECGGKKFYRMSNEYRLPTGRYKWLAAALEEVELRMNLKTLEAYLDEMEKNLNGKKGDINLGKVWQIIYAMRTRTKLAFEPDTIKRLASVVYFDASEDLRDWDKKYAEEKIALWDKHESYAFFLTSPIEELLNLRGISVESLKNYISHTEAIIKELTLDHTTVSSEN